MIKIIVLLMIVIIIGVGVDYILEDSFSQNIRASVSQKYTDGDIYIIKTISLDTFSTSNNIYNKLEVGKTYDFRIFMGSIKEVREV